ncbi:MAG: bifunctional 2-C-methyl-D-erythritol 4-phosphate cytidylyltransferase/2-C-methyl-D-erythritol 2,4-cyclodiphosphate synthase [Paracoccaceae bacterium]
MSISAIIVAAGRGNRVGGDIPKQWRMLRDRPVARWTLEAFARSTLVDRLVLVVHRDDQEIAHEIGAGLDLSVVVGGDSRDASVRAGLEALADTGTTKVLIHDVARPLVDQSVIERVCVALDTAEGAAPAVALSDALWRGESDLVMGVVDRAGLYRAQTPQGFSYAAILAAHRAHKGGAADDVAVARAAGLEVVIVAGDDRNLKITTEHDFERAERLMTGGLDIRVGNGFDVHRFGEGAHVDLCGVAVPHSRGLQGHSDADVGMHALTDAIYGALALGDIGQHFPPSDPQWKGAASRIFLQHAVACAVERGYAISNVDVTLICEQPKIGPHAEAMRRALAEIIGIEANRVSVKATTSEKLGFTGREEGIAANATATLVKA